MTMQASNLTIGDYVLVKPSKMIIKIVAVHCDGSVITRPIQDVDKSASVFTIQDAKAGDILMGNAPFIYNGVLAGGVGCPGAYCGVNAWGQFQIPTNPTHWTVHTTTPATKEQRNLLFREMEKAGYKWNADKKELKKIE